MSMSFKILVKELKKKYVLLENDFFFEIEKVIMMYLKY